MIENATQPEDRQSYNIAEPEIDVVIPVYNAAPTLDAAIESIRRQTASNIKIIVVDDGSTDGTAQILRRIASVEPRLTVLKQPNGGIVEALNNGVRAGRAPLIARHDADDIANPDRLEVQLAFLKTNPGCVAVSGGARHIDSQGRPTGGYVTLWSPETADETWVPAREPALMHPFLMLRRKSLDRVGGYRYVWHAEDADLYWRLQELGHLYNLTDVLGDYRLHADSISSRSIVNGRVQAVNSQLAAIAARRRRSGAQDLTFDRKTLGDYERLKTTEDMVRYASAQLSSAEASYLRIAVAEKLMELTVFRPFELDIDDCRYVRRSLNDLSSAPTSENKAQVLRHTSGTAARLLAKGKVLEAAALCPPFLLPQTLARTFYRKLGFSGRGRI